MGAVVQAETPSRSLQQRQEALARANLIRTYRASLKAELKRGEHSVPDLLDAPPAELDTMKVFTLLLAMPRCGRRKADRLLRRYSISPSKTVAGLSLRQREQLVLALRAWQSGRAPW